MLVRFLEGDSAMFTADLSTGHLEEIDTPIIEMGGLTLSIDETILPTGWRLVLHLILIEAHDGQGFLTLHIYD